MKLLDEKWGEKSVVFQILITTVKTTSRFILCQEIVQALYIVNSFNLYKKFLEENATYLLHFRIHCGARWLNNLHKIL